MCNNTKEKIFMKKLYFIALMCMFTLGCAAHNNDAANHDKTEKAVQVSQKTLKGSWVADAKKFVGAEDQKNIQEASMIFNFDGEALSIVIEMDMHFAEESVQMSIDMGIRMSCIGKYTLADRVITPNSFVTAPKVEVTKFNLNCSDEVRNALNEAGMNEDKLKSMLLDGMKKGGLDSMSQTFESEIIVVSMTNSSMVLKDCKENFLIFKRR